MQPVYLRFILTLIAAALLNGCARPDYAQSWPGHFLLSAGPQPGFAIKRIIERQPPATLVGDDGSVCRTSPERFNRAKEGRWVACSWNLPVLDSTPTVSLRR
jgi:hypothetical protein